MNKMQAANHKVSAVKHELVLLRQSEKNGQPVASEIEKAQKQLAEAKAEVQRLMATEAEWQEDALD